MRMLRRQILRQLRLVVACLALAIALEAPTWPLDLARIAPVLQLVDAAAPATPLSRQQTGQHPALPRVRASAARPASRVTVVPRTPRHRAWREPPVQGRPLDGRHLYLEHLALLC